MSATRSVEIEREWSLTGACRSRSQASFEIADHEVDSNTHVIELHGELDQGGLPFKARWHEVIDAGKTRIVDLAQASFIDSTGLGVLVSGLKRLRGVGGTLVLVSRNRSMLTLFESTGLHRAMPIYETRDPALSSLAGEVGGA